MLVNLNINNIVLIDKLDILFDKNFTALTGETGAGKSILLDALALAMGSKSDLTLIRAFCDKAQVTAQFSLDSFAKDHAIYSLIEQNDIEVDQSNELLLKRTVSHSNKSRAFVNDQPVSVQLLKQFGDVLLNVHGQHDNLFNESSHKTLLDNYAKVKNPLFNDQLSRCKEAYNGWYTADTAFKNYEMVMRDHHKNQLYYAEILKDLSAVNLEVGVEDQLMNERSALQHLGKIIQSVTHVLKGIEHPVSYVTNLHGFQKVLERCESDDFPTISSAKSALERAAIEVSEAVTELKSLFDRERASANTLEEIDEKLHFLRTLARKYHTTCDGLCELYQAAIRFSEDSDDMESKKAELEKNLKLTRAEYEKAQSALLQARIHAGELLTSEVLVELPDLKLDKANFSVHIEESFVDNKSNELQPYIDGGHKVSFMVSMNTGQSLSPLSKSASGGEMARLTLALKMIVAKTTKMPTLIFDEIDTGVGGAVATAIGKKLRALGEFVQVFAITHSPQVAATAHQQWKIFKEDVEGMTTTGIQPLSEMDRLDEIARMLSGHTVTDEAKMAAKALLD